jgi:hypothetical protein
MTSLNHLYDVMTLGNYWVTMVILHPLPYQLGCVWWVAMVLATICNEVQDLTAIAESLPGRNASEIFWKWSSVSSKGLNWM